MRFIERTLSIYASVLLFFSVIAVSAMAFHVAADVVAKLLFRQPLIGTLEMVSSYYMVAVVFLPLVAVQRRRGQIFVELFTQNLSPRTNALIDSIVYLLAFAYVAALFFTAAETAMEKTIARETSTNVEFQIEVWGGRWFVVLGMFGMGLYFLLQGLGDFIYAISGRQVRQDPATP